MRSAPIKRCSWVSVDDPLMLQYHDREWGVPVHDDRKDFEFLVLEGAQAGLSWTIVLKKREGYRRAFGAYSCFCCTDCPDFAAKKCRGKSILNLYESGD